MQVAVAIKIKYTGINRLIDWGTSSGSGLRLRMQSWLDSARPQQTNKHKLALSTARWLVANQFINNKLINDQRKGGSLCKWFDLITASVGVSKCGVISKCVRVV